MAKAAHLLGKNVIETVVVADGGQDRTVGGQRNGRQLLAFSLKAANQLGGKMLGVAGGAAIAAGKNFAAVDQAGRHRFNGGGNRRRHHFDGIKFGVGAVFEVLGNAGN